MGSFSKPKRWVIGQVGTKGYQILYADKQRTSEEMGPKADHLEEWRRGILPNLHLVFKKFDGYARYPLGENEYAGTIPDKPETVEELLWENDLRRNPLSALKTDPFGNTEVGSWMYRDQPTAERQVHVMLFEGEGDGQTTDLYAHEECSAGHPDPEIAVKHYNAVDYNPEQGCTWVQSNLPVENRRSF
ncbi:hypothetical protein [Halostella sp. PRR32]|uniref:hypothetical protein n=1 Tax=Halostella sp. PRR32 TaxID=3098147 RepID=UPI002B1D53DF|nr:hypothetical protein [Halostella sp. PRR32]